MLTVQVALVSLTMTMPKRYINMGLYVTRTNEVEAVEVQIENANELKALLTLGKESQGDLRAYEEHEFAAVVITATGRVRAAVPGEYVYRDAEGLHVASKEAFQAMYEPVKVSAAVKA